jgi:TolA-binding protein
LEGHANLAREAFARSDFRAAMAHADAALNPGPSVVAFVNRATTLLYRGMSENLLGLSEAALVDFGEARTKGDPAISREAAYQTGIIHLVAGRFSKAAADFADVLQDGTPHPATADSRLFLAYCLLKQGKVEEARKSYQAYVALGVSSADSFRTRLRLELEKGTSMSLTPTYPSGNGP